MANDFSNLTALDNKQFEVNLTRGLAYRHGSEWRDDNVRYMKNILQDFKVKLFNENASCFAQLFFFVKDRDVRIIIANFNQTIAIEMFCQVERIFIFLHIKSCFSC